jgi:DNA-binding NtrC family response regulator
VARVLIIDDDPGTQLLLQSRLRDLGHDVVVAPTGAMGVMEARNGGFDLFLVDVVLGAGIDGYEVCKRLKAMPHTHAVPVVLVSGVLKGRDDLHRGYESGCDAFLVKGDNTQLEDVVRAMLRIKSLQDDLQMQNRLLDDHNRRLQEERRRGAEIETALNGGSASAPASETTLPVASMLVDAEGLVRAVDRGAREWFGPDLEGKNLGSLAVGTGLEAFVRDARTESRIGFRLEVTLPRSEERQRLTATVQPIVPRPGHADSGLRIVCFHRRGVPSTEAEAEGRDRAVETEALRLAFGAGSFAGASELAADLRRRIHEASAAAHPMVLRGESGSGRESLARALHYHGQRRGSFLSVDCSALGAEALELELFGGRADAGDSLPGLLERAGSGTVYLSEAALMPVAVQERVLEALGEEKLRRVGETRTRKLRARLVLGTTRDLGAAAEEGEFLPALSRRLGDHVLQVPALRERPEDVVELARAALARFGARLGPVRLSDDVERLMPLYDWPGNLRELESAVERACRSLEGDELLVEHLPRRMRDLFDTLNQTDELPRPAAAGDHGQALGTHLMTPLAARRPQTEYGRQALAEVSQPISLETFERQALLRALDETGGDKLAAARLLKIGKSTLYRKLKRYDIR